MELITFQCKCYNYRPFFKSNYHVRQILHSESLICVIFIIFYKSRIYLNNYKIEPWVRNSIGKMVISVLVPSEIYNNFDRTDKTDHSKAILAQYWINLVKCEFKDTSRINLEKIGHECLWWNLQTNSKYIHSLQLKNGLKILLLINFSNHIGQYISYLKIVDTTPFINWLKKLKWG